MRSSKEGIQQVQKHCIQKHRHFSSAVVFLHEWIWQYSSRSEPIIEEILNEVNTCLTSKMKSEWYFQGPKLTTNRLAISISVPMTVELLSCFFLILTERVGQCKNYKDQLWFGFLYFGRRMIKHVVLEENTNLNNRDTYSSICLSLNYK